MGESNPQTLKAEYNLALCHYRRGERTGTGKMLANVLERGERVMGETHPWTLMFACAQSCFARESGDIDAARELSEAIVARYELMLAESHPFVAGARANQALILRNVGSGSTRTTSPSGPWPT